MITYKDAGVDIDAADELVKRIGRKTKSLRSENVLAEIGGFSSLVKIPAGMKEPVLVSGTDGVGTKLKLAFATGRHDTVGIDLVAMCVNDIITCGAKPLFFLDYFACGKLDVDVAEHVIGGVVEGCRRAGCPLVGGETAEMPDMYGGGEYDLAGFAVGVVDREKILTGEGVVQGDAVLGFASSGLHSNGFSLIRRLLLDKLKMPLEGKVDAFGCTLAEELLRPTKIYTPEVQLLTGMGQAKAFAHITGGGLVGNAARNIPGHLGIVFRRGSWPVPEIFKFVESRSVPGEEMIAVVSEDSVDRCRAGLKDEGLDVFVVGRVASREKEGPAVRFES